MHGFVQAQTFHVGEGDTGVARRQHLFRIVIRLKSDILGFAGGLHLLKQGTQRKADPWHHDRPALYAAMAVDALLGRRELHYLIQAERLRLHHLAFDPDGPLCRELPFRSILGGIFFLRAEFVEVVVGGDDLFG
jgi:hypothetical protein